MSLKPKPNDEIDSATAALHHAVLSVILLGIIMGSLFQITHLLIESRDSASIAALILPR